MIHTPLLADAPVPSANVTWVVLVGLSGVIANVLTAIGTMMMARATFRRQQVDVGSLPDQTIQVEFAKRFLEKHEFELHVQENVRDFASIRDKREEDLRAASGSRKATYEKIEETRKELAKNIDETRGELTDKIENVPDRVVAMLRNFGVIGK